MKTLIFILLKIVETIVIVAVYCGLCYFGYWVDNLIADSFSCVWYSPLYLLYIPLVVAVILFIAILGCGIYFGVVELIKLNLRWSESLYKRIKK